MLHIPTEIDIAALVADLTGPIPVIEGLSGPYPDETAIRDTADQAVAALIAQDAELKRLREALETVAGVGHDMPATWSGDDLAWSRRRAAIMQQTARAALGEKP